jgi:FtsP/CotA-like multicopper oxidase with cupredoxin domain
VADEPPSFHAGYGCGRWCVFGRSLAAGRALAAPSRTPVLSGSEFQLEIGPTPINITGQPRIATAVNGQVPAPILRWREGDTVTLAVSNRLSVPS